MYVLSLIINLVTIARIPIVWCCRFLFFSLLYIFRVHIFLVLCRLCLAYVFTVQCFKSFRYKCAIATSICWVLLTLNKKQQQQKTQKPIELFSSDGQINTIVQNQWVWLSNTTGAPYPYTQAISHS